VLSAALAAAQAGPDFPMTAGEQVRDWVYVDDIVNGLLAAAEAEGVEGEMFELGTGTGHSLLDVVQRLFALAGASSRPRPGLLPYRSGEVMRLIADPRPAAKRLGWAARTDLDVGLAQWVKRS
jgi:nucleoside-diphosphate-sugar epimerase